MFLGQFFKENPNFIFFGNTYIHPDGPGVFQEKYGHRLGQEISKIAKFDFA